MCVKVILFFCVCVYVCAARTHKSRRIALAAKQNCCSEIYLQLSAAAEYVIYPAQ